MSARRRRPRSAKAARSRAKQATSRRPAPAAIEDVRLALLGVYAACDLVRSAIRDNRVDIVMTRSVLQPLRDALKSLGEDDVEILWWPGKRGALLTRIAETEAP